MTVCTRELTQAVRMPPTHKHAHPAPPVSPVGQYKWCEWWNSRNMLDLSARPGCVPWAKHQRSFYSRVKMSLRVKMWMSHASPWSVVTIDISHDAPESLGSVTWSMFLSWSSDPPQSRTFLRASARSLGLVRLSPPAAPSSPLLLLFFDFLSGMWPLVTMTGPLGDFAHSEGSQ